MFQLEVQSWRVIFTVYYHLNIIYWDKKHINHFHTHNHRIYCMILFSISKNAFYLIFFFLFLFLILIFFLLFDQSMMRRDIIYIQNTYNTSGTFTSSFYQRVKIIVLFYLIFFFLRIVATFTKIFLINIFIKALKTLLLIHFEIMWRFIFFFIYNATWIFTDCSISFIYFEDFAIFALISFSNFWKFWFINSLIISIFILLLLVLSF